MAAKYKRAAKVLSTSRPRMFGGEPAPQLLPWAWAERQLRLARNYWIATTLADGRAHTRPVWGVWLNNTFYFSTGSLAAGNLTRSDEITVHLESGDSAVIIEGRAAHSARRRDSCRTSWRCTTRSTAGTWTLMLSRGRCTPSARAWRSGGSPIRAGATAAPPSTARRRAGSSSRPAR